MDMKEKMPLTPMTPVPTTSAAIPAEARRRGPSTADQDVESDDSRGPNAVDARAGEAETWFDTPAPSAEAVPGTRREPKMSAERVSVFYGDKQALKDVSIQIYEDLVTAFSGPSGCGKSTFLPCRNRMNDTIPSARVTGRIDLD